MHWVVRRLVVGVVGLCLLVSTGKAQQCNLDRKSITFTITLCSQKGCIPGAERVDIIGNHVIHYSNAASQIGTVYTLGQTVDLCNDPTNAGLWAPRCSNVNDIVKANANATYTGNEIRLSVEQDFYKRALNNMLYARVVDLMRIGIISCNACRLLGYTLTGYRGGATQTLLSMGGSAGCQIGELPR